MWGVKTSSHSLLAARYTYKHITHMRKRQTRHDNVLIQTHERTHARPHQEEEEEEGGKKTMA